MVQYYAVRCRQHRGEAIRLTHAWQRGMHQAAAAFAAGDGAAASRIAQTARRKRCGFPINSSMFLQSCSVAGRPPAHIARRKRWVSDRPTYAGARLPCSCSCPDSHASAAFSAQTSECLQIKPLIETLMLQAAAVLQRRGAEGARGGCATDPARQQCGQGPRCRRAGYARVARLRGSCCFGCPPARYLSIDLITGIPSVRTHHGSQTSSSRRAPP